MKRKCPILLAFQRNSKEWEQTTIKLETNNLLIANDQLLQKLNKNKDYDCQSGPFLPCFCLIFSLSQTLNDSLIYIPLVVVSELQSMLNAKSVSESIDNIWQFSQCSQRSKSWAWCLILWTSTEKFFWAAPTDTQTAFRELHASSWNCIPALGTACKLM